MLVPVLRSAIEPPAMPVQVSKVAPVTGELGATVVGGEVCIGELVGTVVCVGKLVGSFICVGAIVGVGVFVGAFVCMGELVVGAGVCVGALVVGTMVLPSHGPRRVQAR